MSRQDWRDIGEAIGVSILIFVVGSVILVGLLALATPQ